MTPAESWQLDRSESWAEVCRGECLVAVSSLSEAQPKNGGTVIFYTAPLSIVLQNLQLQPGSRLLEEDEDEEFCSDPAEHQIWTLSVWSQ